jgi:hypothetical protein
MIADPEINSPNKIQLNHIKIITFGASPAN